LTVLNVYKSILVALFKYPTILNITLTLIYLWGLYILYWSVHKSNLYSSELALSFLNLLFLNVVLSCYSSGCAV